MGNWRHDPTAFAILATFGFPLLAAVIRGLQRPAGKLVSSQRSQNSNQKLRPGRGDVSLFHFHNSDTTVCPFVQSQFNLTWGSIVDLDLGQKESKLCGGRRS